MTRPPSRKHHAVALLVAISAGWACTKEAASSGSAGSAGGAAGIAAAAGQSATGGAAQVSDGASDAAGAAGAATSDAATTGDAAAQSDVAMNGDLAVTSDATRNQPDAGPDAAGTIVPLYTYPTDASWAALVAARNAHATVHVVAIVNPDSGPGASKDAAFTTGIAKLIASDVQVIGYVATGYASHTLASMEATIDRWKAFYPQIQGIFFDEQSDQATDVAYYRTLSQYAKAHGLTYTVGNPGTDTAEAFVGALDTMLIYESKGLPKLSQLAGWHTKYAATNFGVIPYGAAFDASFVQQARQDVGYIYLQSDDLPNPWDTLPAYFGDLLGALE